MERESPARYFPSIWNRNTPFRGRSAPGGCTALPFLPCCPFCLISAISAGLHAFRRHRRGRNDLRHFVTVGLNTLVLNLPLCDSVQLRV